MGRRSWQLAGPAVAARGSGKGASSAWIARSCYVRHHQSPAPAAKPAQAASECRQCLAAAPTGTVGRRCPALAHCGGPRRSNVVANALPCSADRAAAARRRRLPAGNVARRLQPAAAAGTRAAPALAARLSALARASWPPVGRVGAGEVGCRVRPVRRCGWCARPPNCRAGARDHGPQPPRAPPVPPRAQQSAPAQSATARRGCGTTCGAPLPQPTRTATRIAAASCSAPARLITAPTSKRSNVETNRRRTNAEQLACAMHLAR